MRQVTRDSISEIYDSLDGYGKLTKEVQSSSLCLTLVYCTRMIISILVALHKELVANIPMPEEK